jgi:acetoin utilization deacetylase AcuC-like enzyme
MPAIAWSDLYAHPLKRGHRFPMEKYDALPKRLMAKGIIRPHDLFEPHPLSWDAIAAVHTHDYIAALRHCELPAAMVRRIGFPLSLRLVQRERVIACGSVMAARIAQKTGVAFNAAGGTHHAFADRGEGFCLLNDLALAAADALQRGIQRVLIIDLDVHQGNGTAEIFVQNPRVFTFSMHAAGTFPLIKTRSDLDIALPDHCKGTDYLDALNRALSQIFPLHQPELVLYNAGVDVLQGDKTGRLSLEPEECRLRDRLVFEACRRWNTPVAVAMGGGYHPDIKRILDAHCATFEESLICKR